MNFALFKFQCFIDNFGWDYVKAGQVRNNIYGRFMGYPVIAPQIRQHLGNPEIGFNQGYH